MILVIDANNELHKIWHANSGLNVVPTCCNRIRALIDHLRPSDVFACFDSRSFRHDLIETHNAAGGTIPEYKAARPDRDPALDDAIAAAPLAFGQAGAMPVHEDGYEADDLLATFAHIGSFFRDKVVLASGDKDLRQCLVDGLVTQLRAFGTFAGNIQADKLEWFTTTTLLEKYGLVPGQWPDYQTLVGDSTDGIGGCPGWGEKTAAAALVKCGSLDRMIADPWAVPCTQSQRTKLLAFRPLVELTRRLVTLRVDSGAVMDAMK